MKTLLNTIALKSIELTTSDFAAEGIPMTPSNLVESIECACMVASLTFENDSAESNFITCVLKEVKNVDSKFYDLVYPPCRMDANGNYTYNSNKWA